MGTNETLGYASLLGGVAQLVERPLCKREASGSNPLISTNFRIVLCIKDFKKILVIFEMFVI